MRPVSLQTRTVLTLLAILLPLLTLFTTYRIIVEARTRHTQRLERVITRIDANSEALCRARRRLPRRLERQLRGLKVHVYQKDMTPVLPRTPPLPTPQREQLRALSGDEFQELKVAHAIASRNILGGFLWYQGGSLQSPALSSIPCVNSILLIHFRYQ